MKALLAATLLLAACNSDSGLLAITLTSAPQSTVIASIQKLRVTTTNPRSVTEAVRGANGIDLAVEFEPSEVPGVVSVEGFGADGELVATGQSAPFTLGGGDASLAIYVAPPLSIAEAPVRLPTARGDVAANSIVFGAVIAGGIDNGGGVSDAMTIYNVYTHALQNGVAMPTRRRGQAISANVNGVVYLYGGAGENAAPTSNFYEFITTTAPAGGYIDVGEQTGYERAHETALAIDGARTIVTGSPPLLMTLGSVTARELPALSPRGASALHANIGTPGTAAALRADFTALVTTDGTDYAEITLPTAASAAGVAALADGFLVVGGSDTSALHVSGTTVTPLAAALSTPRNTPCVVATGRHIVVAGGADAVGMPLASADILDAVTLERVATVPLVARANARCVALPNDQVMIVGGDDPTDLIELFTPPVAN